MWLQIDVPYPLGLVVLDRHSDLINILVHRACRIVTNRFACPSTHHFQSDRISHARLAISITLTTRFTLGPSPRASLHRCTCVLDIRARVLYGQLLLQFESSRSCLIRDDSPLVTAARNYCVIVQCVDIILIPQDRYRQSLHYLLHLSSLTSIVEASGLLLIVVVTQAPVSPLESALRDATAHSSYPFCPYKQHEFSPHDLQLHYPTFPTPIHAAISSLVQVIATLSTHSTFSPHRHV